MERTQFTFYASYFNAVKQLSRRDQSAVLLAICAYALEEQEPELTGTAGAIFELIRPTLDASRRKAIAGQARRRKRESEEQKAPDGHEQRGSKQETERKQTESKTGTNSKQNGNEKKKEKEYEVEKEYEYELEKEYEIENECLDIKKEIFVKRKSPDGLKATTTKRFVKPTVEEVAEYCRERGNGINAAHFVDYYEANGWHVGRQGMKDWRAAVRTWERHGNGGHSGGGGRFDYLMKSIREDLRNDGSGDKDMHGADSVAVDELPAACK